ncbi:hypothetical protein E2C01_048043 [Portunus trituberculatus]|uniref:Uncharacterized protein n=1 Tax=Portunus trituberculatus TaxID=210409 RepID=A0A5B7G9H3_PORTR|nr:hypothetical protein [Portunus trituberculatus]
MGVVVSGWIVGVGLGHRLPQSEWPCVGVGGTQPNPTPSPDPRRPMAPFQHTIGPPNLRNKS